MLTPRPSAETSPSERVERIGGLEQQRRRRAGVAGFEGESRADCLGERLGVRRTLALEATGVACRGSQQQAVVESRAQGRQRAAGTQVVHVDADDLNVQEHGVGDAGPLLLDAPPGGPPIAAIQLDLRLGREGHEMLHLKILM